MAYCPLYAPGHLGAKSELNLFEEPVIQELAKKYEKTLAQIILRYLVSIILRLCCFSLIKLLLSFLYVQLVIVQQLKKNFVFYC